MIIETYLSSALIVGAVLGISVLTVYLFLFRSSKTNIGPKQDWDDDKRYTSNTSQ